MTKEIVEKIKEKIKTNEIEMRPHYYFVLGTLSLAAATVGSFLLTTFFLTALFYRVRIHGLECALVLSRVPWVLIFLTLGFFALGVHLFKKYDISYKVSVLLITIILAILVMISGYVIDERDMHRPMRQSPVMGRLFEDRPRIGTQQLNQMDKRNIPGSMYQIHRENNPTNYKFFDIRRCQ